MKTPLVAVSPSVPAAKFAAIVHESIPAASPFAAPQRQATRRPWLALLALTLSTALLPARAQDEFNILANDEDHKFKPKIVFSETNSDRINVLREDGSVSFDVVANPGRIGACLVGNLVQFPFAEIAEDMPVAVTIGGFTFEATLGDDNSRRVDREGNLLPFDASKKSAIFYFTMELPPATEEGDPRFRRVGYVKFSWNTKTVTATVVVNHVEGAGVAGIYDRGGLIELAEFDGEKGGARLFKNEPVEASLTFGSATGTRTVVGGGKVQTRYRKVGSEIIGNSDILQLDSLLAVGGADVKAPNLVLNVPILDEDGDGQISFNGMLSDLAPSSLSGALFLPSFNLFVNGVAMLSDVEVPEDELPDYTLVVTDPDATGKCIFTITNLILPEGPGLNTVLMKAVDMSGNARKAEAKVADSGLNH